MNEGYSPTLFLFQSHVGEVLKEGKRLIKSAPFDGIDPESNRPLIQLSSIITNINTWINFINTSSQP